MTDFLKDEPCACEPRDGAHVLTELPYAHDALEPHIDARTMEIHHTAHHASYVKKLNAAIEDAAGLRDRSAFWLLMNLDEVPADIRTAVRNNAGGHVNHCMFWRGMSPDGGGAPTGALARAIDDSFGGFDAFRREFNEAGEKLFGSGWVWLVVDRDGSLRVTTTAGHDNPAADGAFPVLVNDGWEHAFYLKHQNRKAEYFDGWWAVVDWDEAAARHARAMEGAMPAGKGSDAARPAVPH